MACVKCHKELNEEWVACPFCGYAVSGLDVPALASQVRTILTLLGENPDRDGLQKTPMRVAKAYEFLTSGYRMQLSDVVNGAIFEEQIRDDMVVVRDIEIYSLCEHHMIPFYGRVHIGYIPDGKVLGLSKLARIAELFARRLQIQERLTDQIADAVFDTLQPLGVGVVVESKHMCMSMRGAQKTHSNTVTSCMRGIFREDGRTRSEFFSLIRHHVELS